MKRDTAPDPLKIHVTDASLTRLNSDNYNLALTIALENRNEYFQIYYDNAQVVARYNNKSAVASVDTLHQLEKSTTLLTPLLKLQHGNNSTDIVDDDAAGNYHYDIVVKLYLPKTYKSISIIMRRNDWQSGIHLYVCDLKVPAALNIRGSNYVHAFNTTECAPIKMNTTEIYSYNHV
uniref:protein YLS9-like n=1 Tax=Fragaria vesca subsp. vesca TaxID=101020 RepID=UPI0005CB104B|nr:PREDICTED: protein YLS9-like [Fragaria vesca subsp. vesca]